MGGNSMSLMLAVFVGVAIGAFVFGGSGGIASAAQGGSWTFLLFLIPCLLMFGAMMMMGNKSGSDGKP
jgi:amino acid transporter